MKKVYLFVVLIFTYSLSTYGQEIQMSETATLEQVYGENVESENLLPFNDLNIEFGYVLYEAKITTESEEVVLDLENVRDYAVVFIDNTFQGTLTDNRKKLTLDLTPGEYTLQLYAENIGRITYGPEILDNSKGLFGSITLDNEEIENWKITPLDVKNCDVNDLQFTEQSTNAIPCFHKGNFEMTAPKDAYLDISGWGMGEVWLNGNYMGSYWRKKNSNRYRFRLKT